MTFSTDISVSETKVLAELKDLKNPALEVATGVYVTVHGHFYQPPRENPYLDAIERQPSASPFHDWNERIHHECYRPNAFARVLNEQGELVNIVNNYEYLSFNIGATLMNWLERHDVEVYQRILDADRKSCDRLNGHGNAIAQVYNHIIMPLANERDKYTQIRWGIADFRSRFHREPEGMWLAETAVDYETLEVLVAAGIKFIILAPSQAQKCRMMPTAENPAPEWNDVSGNQIDATRPYRCYLKDKGRKINSNLSDSFPSCFLPRGTNPYIDIFFYDGPISRDMGFSDVLSYSPYLTARLGQAVRVDNRPAQLIAVATDGETFGHHKGGTEKCLAHAFTHEFNRCGWTVTNFAHYLSINPPSWEVELKPVTAWSCAHGVGRWQDDCGCASGGGWHQKWRRPLRNALDWLRDQLIPIYDQIGRKFLLDPWQARDEYINIIRDRSPENIANFLSRHQLRSLTPAEQVDTLRLLEMQRQTLLMYTSCGWFFEEISRPEGVQVLRYAARALELGGEVAGVQLEKEFLERLALAPSNVDLFKNGAEVYRQLVVSAQISFNQVAAHYAISSLFSHYPQQDRLYCYETHQLDYQLQRMGPMSLAIGQLRLVSQITWESEHLVFAVLHLSGWDFHCCIQPFAGRRAYSYLKEELSAAFQKGSAAATILTMIQLGGDQSFNLQDLFAEERHRIMRLLSQETLTRLDQLYTQVYRENYGVLMAFKRDELSVPQELQVAAEIALSYSFLTSLRALEQETGELQNGLIHLAELEAIASEAELMRCRLNIADGKQIMEQIIVRSLWHLLHNPNLLTIDADIQRLERIIAVGNQLNLGLSLDRAQETYYTYLESEIIPQYRQINPEQLAKVKQSTNKWNLSHKRQLLRLGQKLGVDVSIYLTMDNG